MKRECMCYFVALAARKCEQKPDFIYSLMKNGANESICGASCRQTALHIAASAGESDAAMMLVESSKLDINIQDDSGK